jgi:DNA repair protein RadC
MQLLNRYGSLAEALAEAGSDTLDATSELLVSVRDAMLQSLRAPLREQPVMSTSEQVLDFLIAALGHQTIEVVWALFLDTSNRLLCDEMVSRGSVSQAAIYPRQLIKRALDVGATGIILAHNHPSGLPQPSRADIEMTAHVVRACRDVEIAVLDHLVITRRGWTSMQAEGLLYG